MTYQESLDYLYNERKAFHLVGTDAYKPGLDTTRQLLRVVGNHLGERAQEGPQALYPTVHIAGTNGKGSTAHLIAAALQCAGLKVGLFTSPHLVDFSERIRINGQPIPHERVARFVEEYRAEMDRLQPSFFECTTALGLLYFAEEQVDVAVIETGLGGRLDSTNVITPVLSVITNIGLEHTDLLGHTLEAIAREKAGIIKPGVPCVIGETHPLTEPVFRAKADGRIWFADQCEYLRRVRKDYPCQLQGVYQEKNMQTAYVALRALRDVFPTLTEQAIRDGFAQAATLTGLRGRWERLSESPLVLCDTGHNAHGIATYVEQLRTLSRGDSHLRMVFGMVADKDVDAVMKLLPREAYYYWTEARTHRALSSEEMQRKGLLHGLIGKAYGAVDIALQAAIDDAAPEDVVFVGGSNYVVGEAIAYEQTARN